MDPELMPLMQAASTALVEYTPPHFRSILCDVFQASEHAQGRLRYQIGSREFPAEGTEVPSKELHEATHQLYQRWAKIDPPCLPFRLSAEQAGDGRWNVNLEKFDDPQPVAARSDAAEEARWQAVTRARQEFFVEQFGPLPSEIQRLLNLSGVWPAGGIYSIDAGRFVVTASSGLSNYDMPTKRVSAKATTGAGLIPTVEPREPRWVHSSLAGYGYELAILTPRVEAWPLAAVSWFVQMEVMHDLDWLARVDQYGGMTVQDIEIGDGRPAADFLIEKALPPLAAGIAMPNGHMHLLVATLITRDEMNFSLEHGPPALRQRLTAGGIGQVSDRSRRPDAAS